VIGLKVSHDEVYQHLISGRLKLLELAVELGEMAIQLSELPVDAE
jgi:hypothetical protein